MSFYFLQCWGFDILGPCWLWKDCSSQNSQLLDRVNNLPIGEHTFTCKRTTQSPHTPPSLLLGVHSQDRYSSAVIRPEPGTRQRESPSAPEPAEIIQTNQSQLRLPCRVLLCLQKPQYRLLPCFPLTLSASRLPLVLPVRLTCFPLWETVNNNLFFQWDPFQICWVVR